jgi:hypothetical protein
MEKESFIYTIASTEKKNNDDLEYVIDVGGFGSSFNHFNIEVLNLVLDGGVDPDDGYLILVCKDLGSSGYFCTSKLPSNESMLCVVGTNDDILMGNGGITFHANNLRMKREVRFKFLMPSLEDVVDDVNINVVNITDWLLTLKVTPIE